MSELKDFLPTFENLIQKPEDYLQVQNEVSRNVTGLLKNIYDFTKISENGLPHGDALPELIVDGFDEEQIWQELELQNSGCFGSLVTDVAGLVARKDRLAVSEEEDGDQEAQTFEPDVPIDDIPENEDFDGIPEDEDIDTDGFDGPEAASDDLQTPEEESEDDEDKRKPTKQKGLSRVSEVDDKFFKLSEMEEFLEQEEKQSGKHDSSDDFIDLFRSSDEEDIEESGSEDLHYADFFDAPHDEKLPEGQLGNKEKKKKKKKKKEKEEVEEEEVEEEEVEEEEEEEEEVEEVGGGGDEEEYESIKGAGKVDEEKEEGKEEQDDVAEKKVRFMSSGESSDEDIQQPKSSLEARQERLQARIRKLEEQALAEKPWQLKGEVSASGRPQNSLLEEVVDFDLTTRPAPVMTEKTTLQLEDIIKQRIKDKAWDDVERKIKPVETPSEYKKKLVLDQEKSKISLAQVYEQEYLKQKEAVQDDGTEKPQEEPPEHDEIRKMMSSLFVKLDALSNFHYTPRAPAPELKIVSNLPAITMEEVAPVAVSDATLLAPEEVKERPKGDIMSKTERTETDKKRERRQKKIRQRERQREREKKERAVEKMRPGLGNKYSKEKALRDLEKVTKESNVTRMDENKGAKAVKSSTAFFNQLQDEVKAHIKKRVASGKASRTQKMPSAKKLKL